MPDFSRRLAAIPDHVLELTRAGLSPNATLGDILRHSITVQRRLADQEAGNVRDEDKVRAEYFLTWRYTRVIREALEDYQTPVADDEMARRKLIAWMEEK